MTLGQNVRLSSAVQVRFNRRRSTNQDTHTPTAGGRRRSDGNEGMWWCGGWDGVSGPTLTARRERGLRGLISSPGAAEAACTDRPTSVNAKGGRGSVITLCKTPAGHPKGELREE